MTYTIEELFSDFAPSSGQDIPAASIDTAMEIIFPEPVIYDPVGWAYDHGIDLWSKQRELLQSIADNKFTACRACHEVGKSFAMAVAILSWIDTFGHDAFVVFTAPTYPQVDAIIGRELRDLVTSLRLDHIEVMASNEIKYKGLMRGYGRKPADHNPAGLSGLHARRPFVVIDEGCAVPKNLFIGANTIAGHKNARVCTIGNPDNPVSHFRTLFEPGSKWNQIKIDAYSSPNFTGERGPEIWSEVLIEPETVEEWKNEWGENSPLFSSKVKAEFPQSSEFSVFDYQLILDSFEEVERSSRPLCLTLDVASGGKDEAIAYAIRADGSVTEEFSESKSDLMALADRTANWWRNNRRTFVVVDANGQGEGVYSRLRQLRVRVKPFYGQQAPRDKKTYVNARAEAAFETARAMRGNKITLDLRDDILRGELPTVFWEFGEKNKIKLMSKEDMAERGLASPNRADALSMGVWHLGIGKVASGATGFASSGVKIATGGYAT